MGGEAGGAAGRRACQRCWRMAGWLSAGATPTPPPRPANQPCSAAQCAGLHDEYRKAADWVLAEMPLDAKFDASVFETIIRVVGGLLAAHDLTGDPAMLARWGHAGISIGISITLAWW